MLCYKWLASPKQFNQQYSFEVYASTNNQARKKSFLLPNIMDSFVYLYKPFLTQQLKTMKSKK